MSPTPYGQRAVTRGRGPTGAARRGCSRRAAAAGSRPGAAAGTGRAAGGTTNIFTRYHSAEQKYN